MNSSTIQYYDTNADAYCKRTVEIDMKACYEDFLAHLPEKASILDAGCGSGRDTKYFLSLGHTVVAMDASIEMVRKSSELTSQQTLHLSFEKMAFREEFDGIWCSASLLHVPSKDIMDVFRRIKLALKPSGLWFLSFYSGNSEVIRGDRFYHDVTPDTLQKYIQDLGEMTILELKEMPSLEKGSTTRWIHAIVKKSN